MYRSPEQGYPFNMNKIAEAWATFFFVGRSPKAPGTLGSLAALPLAWFVWQLPVLWGCAITFLVFFTGAEAAKFVIRRTGESDNQSIVIDEVVGILITTSIAAHLWWQYALAFLLFRIFDIWKPWPVGFVDRQWKSAYGTMMDDVVAAFMAAALLFLVVRYSAPLPAA